MSGVEPLVALGLASNVVQFFDFGSKLCARIKEFSSTASKALGEIGELADRPSLTLSILKNLDQEGLKAVGKRPNDTRGVPKPCGRAG